MVPSDDAARALAAMIADAGAIPTAVFSAARCATRRVVDLTPIDLTVLDERAAIVIPEASRSLSAAAAEHVPTLSR